MDEEDNMLVLLENSQDEFWNRFYQERGDLRLFAMNQMDHLLNAELRNQFLDRLNLANWNRRMDPGFEETLLEAEEKQAQAQKRHAEWVKRQKEAEKIARDAEKAIREARKKAEKAEAQKRHAEWVKRQNEKFEAEKIARAAEKAIREARNKAEKARKKANTDLNKANRIRLSSLGLH
ncbi:hypothetical protein Bca101_027382 [Brassica carinata]